MSLNRSKKPILGHLACHVALILASATVLVPFLWMFFFNDTATTEIYTSGHTLSLHDALSQCRQGFLLAGARAWGGLDLADSDDLFSGAH